jgi:hypothetical protein
MFSSNHYINNISLFFIAFVNSFYILSLDNNLRLPAFIFFAGFLIVFPGLSVIKLNLPFKLKNYIIPFLAAAVILLLVFLFTRFHAEGYIPALSFIFFIGFLLLESGRGRELIIKSFMMMTAPVILTDIILNGKVISAGLLFIIIIFLQNESNERERPGFPLYFYSFLAGAVLVTHSQLLIVYLFSLLYTFRGNAGRLFITLFITAVSFLLIVYNMAEGNFTAYLSFYMNTSLLFQMPVWTIVLLIIAALYIAWITAEMNEVYFASALFILIPSIIILIINILEFGIAGLRNLNYMTDFAITIPLFIAAIKDYKVDKFRGRIFKVESAAV